MSQTVVFFRGDNANNLPGLWETNGTASGTFQLASVPPNNLVAFNDEVLFEGQTGSDFGLWATNGTPSGTVQLTPITGAATNFRPSDLTVFGAEVLFNGTDTGGHASLWKTGGTAATTQEITGITGPAAAAGLNPSDLTVFNGGEVLFNGDDSRSNTAGRAVSGLWETDGTGAGTIELIGAGTGGGSAQGGLNPEDIIAFGADALFAATNASGLVGLWEWNSSTPTTATEVTVAVAGANTGGLVPTYLTDLNGLALFSGLAADDKNGLFKFNLTTGTGSELSGTDIHDAVVSDLDPKFLTAFGSEVLFNGTDSTGAQGLWETNGTTTQEIFAGVGGPSDLIGLDPENFEVFNGQVLFSGRDGSGDQQLWETDGEVGGTTQQVTGINNVSASGLAPSDLTSLVPPPVVHSNNLSQVVHPNNLALSGSVTGAHNFIDTLNFVASYGDLINAFGTDQQTAQNWYNTREPIEQRVETFDGLDYIASYGDLINAFKSAGSKQAVLDIAGATHFIDDGFHEAGRTTTFNGLDYIASYGDLINAFGANGDAGAYHYIENGASEGRKTTFDGLDYIASYGDLIKAFGANEQAGAAHFIDDGSKEGRTTTFNGLDYIASYGDLIKAFGANNDAGATHYIDDGHNEGRTTTFDGLDYIASYGDLIKALGANEQAGAEHFIDNGFKEGRTTTFDGLDYIANYTDLMKAFGANNDAGATHYIDNGFSEHRSTSFNVGAYESAHPDLIGKYASNDAFLTAYINTYKATGTFLT